MDRNTHRQILKKPILALIMCIGLSQVYWVEAQDLSCKVSGTHDYFELYSEQIVSTTDQFIHYQMINGLTVIIVNKQNLHFNRLSNLNLLPHSTLDLNKQADDAQWFTGICTLSPHNR